MSERVVFVGPVDDYWLPSYYAATDVVILPSTSRLEAFGIVGLEGMATGKPLILSDIPGVRDVISEKEKNTTLNQFKSVKYEYEAQKIRYKRVLWEFDNLNIKAPFDGFINKFYFDVGQKIVRGSNVIEFLDNSVLIGRASLSSENIRKIKDSNQIIRFTAKGMPFQARVSGISRQMNKDVSSYSLEFKIINDENNLIPGEVVEIEIEIENFENYISIPSSSIIIENNKSYLFLERNNIVKRIEIKPIQLDNKDSLVKDSEIPDSYRVITQGQSNLQEGSRIKVDE